MHPSPPFVRPFVRPQGDVVPIADPQSPPITPPSIPAFNPDDADHYMQGQLSSYTLDSAAYTYYSAGLTQWLIDSTKIPMGLNSTDSYVLIAPGLPLAYPKSSVSLNVGFSALPDISFGNGGINVTAPISIAWEVNADNGSLANPFSILATTSLSGDLRIGTDSNGSMAIMGTVEYLSAQLSTLSSDIGTINTGLLQT